MSRAEKKNVGILKGLAILIVAFVAFGYFFAPPEESSFQSDYSRDIRGATTSAGLSNADLAWHAVNTYGWDCSTVISKGEMTNDGYYPISCTSGIELRVYPRRGTHPKITNSNGSYQ